MKDMALRNRFNTAILLALLTANQSLVTFVSADVFVCGSDYNDASKNCTVNTACPNGDGCPDDKATCFSMPEERCFGPTIFPSEAPSLSPMFVCGLSYDDALTNCRSNAECLDGKCGDKTLACFPIPDALCPTSAPSYSPTAIPKVCGIDSFDAKTNCLDLSKRCPSGEGCPSGTACFSVPTNECGAMKEPTMSPSVTMEPTMSPSVPMEPTMSPSVPKETTMSPSVTVMINSTVSPTSVASNVNNSSMVSTSPTAASMNQDVVATTTSTSPSTAAPITSTPSASPIYNTFFCGETYELAEANCWTAEPCPSGSGCSKAGEDCFGISADRCYSDAPTEAPTGLGPRPSASPSVSSKPSYLPSVPITAAPITSTPSASPIYNTYYCGETYELAEANCWTAQPCPSGSGCSKAGEQCFAISTDRCYSAAPTDTPTGPGPRPSATPSVTSSPSYLPSISMIPTKLPTLSPSKSPIINSFYCGMDYESASTQCANATPCPDGSCPGSMICFGNIECVTSSPTLVAATIISPAPSSPPQTTNADTGTIAPARPAPSGPPQTTIADNGTIAPASASGPSFSMPPFWEDVAGKPTIPQNSTATLAPASAGYATLAPAPADSMTIPEPSPTTIIASSPKPSKQVEFDPNKTFYCGNDYNDAYMNCYTQVPCPSGAMEDCPAGQSCFPITFCSPPSPAASTPSPAASFPSPAASARPMFTNVVITTDLSPGTTQPSSKSSGTLAPTWDFSSFGASPDGERNDAEIMLSFSVSSLLWIGLLIVGLV